MNKLAMKKFGLLLGILAVISVCAGVLCGCGKDVGTLYRLEEVYASQAIGKEDLLNIAYHNGDVERNEAELQNFEPKPIGELNEKTAQRIRECVAEVYLKVNFSEATAENVIIKEYLGCYNGYYAVRFTNNLSDRLDWETDPEDYIEEVGGIKLSYYRTSFIHLWIEN